MIPIPPLLPLPNLELGRVSRVGLVMLVVGLALAMFSAYMLSSSVQQTHKIGLLVEQTSMLRQELDNDHIWQVQHHELLEQLEQLVRLSVLRKEALIRGIVKRRYGWTEEDVRSAIASEMGNIPDSTVEIFRPTPLLPLPAPTPLAWPPPARSSPNNAP